MQWIRSVTHNTVAHMAAGEVSDWVLEYRRREWSWAGHCARREDGRWTRVLLEISLPGGRPRGRPPLHWADEIVQFLEHVFGGDTRTSWIDVAQQRDVWALLREDFATFRNP